MYLMKENLQSLLLVEVILTDILKREKSFAPCISKLACISLLNHPKVQKDENWSLHVTYLFKDNYLQRTEKRNITSLMLK